MANIMTNTHMAYGKILNLPNELKRRYWLKKMIKEAENPFIKTLNQKLRFGSGQTKNPFKQSYQGPLAKSDFDGFTHLR